MGKSTNLMFSFYDSGRGPFRLRPESHRLDEFAASYSSAGCTPAVPASASPAGFYVPSASRNCKPPLDQGWGIFNRHNEEFSTGVDSSTRWALYRNRGELLRSRSTRTTRRLKRITYRWSDIWPSRAA